MRPDEVSSSLQSPTGEDRDSQRGSVEPRRRKTPKQRAEDHAKALEQKIADAERADHDLDNRVRESIQRYGA